MDVFEAPKLKVKRAEQHISDLNMRLAAYAKTDFYRLSINEDEKPGDSILQFQVIDPISPAISSVIGDAVHNLRSALDLLITGIVKEKLGTWEVVYFPISKGSRDDLIGTLKGGKIKPASPSAT